MADKKNQKLLNKAYENEYAKLAGFDKIPSKWKKSIKDFMYSRSAWYRMHNIMMLRFNVLPLKIGYSLAVFRGIRKNKTSAFSLLYQDIRSDIKKDKKAITYVALGPSLTSSDGEYRPYFIQLDVLLEYYKFNIDMYDMVEKHLIEQIESGDLELGVEIFPAEKSNSDKWSKEINENRYPIKLYSYCWMLMAWQFFREVSPNHVFKNFKPVMYDDKSATLYKTLSSLKGEDKVVEIGFHSGTYFESIQSYKRGGGSSSLKLGHKLIPLTLADIRNFKNPKHRPWRELYVDYLVGKLVVNLITPGVPIMGEYFFVQSTDHGMYDNDAMHTKIDHSKIGEEIVEQLESLKEQTKKESKFSDEPQFLNMRFKNLSDSLESSIEQTEEEIIMSGISMCKIIENIGFTIRDIVRIGNKDIRGMIGPLLSSPRVWGKYMFELVYNLLCLNSKIGVIQGDLHLNNAVIFPFAKTDFPKNNTFIIYQLENDSYKFPHYGSFGGIIDFSRAIVSQQRIKEDYGDKYSEEYVAKQKTSILAFYSIFFPEFYSIHRFKLNNLLKEDFELGFKICTAMDSYRLFSDLVVLLKSSTKTRVSPKNIALVEKIRNISTHFLTETMQKVLINDKSLQIVVEFPHATIIRECFQDYVVNTNEELPDDEIISDIFNYENPLKYDHQKEKDFPDILTRDFDKKITSKLKMKPFIKMTRYSQYWKNMPEDFTEVVKNLKKIPIKKNMNK